MTDPTPERPESRCERCAAPLGGRITHWCGYKEQDAYQRGLEHGRKEERERLRAIIRNPYGDAVACFGSDEPFTVAIKIERALAAQAPEKEKA
jgi:hypothetical protein